MTVDRNAMARALNRHGMTEDDLFLALDSLRSLAIDVLDGHSESLDPGLREGLRSHVDRLKPIMNATFRPVGIESDPFVPRYSGHRIEYRADERGFAMSVFGEDGQRIMRPYVCNDRLEIVGDLEWDVPGPEAAVGALSAEEIVAAARDFAGRMAAMWELPVREPYVGEASEESEMETILASLQPSVPAVSSPRP